MITELLALKAQIQLLQASFRLFPAKWLGTDAFINRDEWGRFGNKEPARTETRLIFDKFSKTAKRAADKLTTDQQKQLRDFFQNSRGKQFRSRLKNDISQVSSVAAQEFDRINDQQDRALLNGRYKLLVNQITRDVGLLDDSEVDRKLGRIFAVLSTLSASERLDERNRFEREMDKALDKIKNGKIEESERFIDELVERLG